MFSSWNYIIGQANNDNLLSKHIFRRHQTDIDETNDENIQET